MDTSNYFNTLGVFAAFISIYAFIVRPEIRKLFEKLKYKIGLGTHERKLKSLLQNYQLHKHLAKSPFNRNTALSTENLRMLLPTIFFGLATSVFIYDISTATVKVNNYSKASKQGAPNEVSSDNIKTPSLLQENKPKKITPEEKDLKNFLPHDRKKLMHMMWALMSSALLGLWAFRDIMKRLSPPFYFKRFHELSVCQIYELLKKIDKPENFYAIKEIEKIVLTSLEKEFPANELTDLGLAFFSRSYDYPKAIKKKMKNRNYNFDTDKEGLKRLLGLIPESAIPPENTVFKYKQNMNIHFHKNFKWPS
tara:strand:+ start:294 stop:1217 length:924 start_codon:yes stop_codon:yes gene_type:complete